MSDPNTYTVTGLSALLILNVGKWLQEYYQYKKSNNKDNNKPGKAPECIERGKKFAVMETKLEYIIENQKKMDGKLDIINKGINGK